MPQQYSSLFVWWVVTISWSTIFLIIVSVYLYRGRKKSERRKTVTTFPFLQVMKDFVFVWVLIVLLIFYIVSISQRSALLFAIGNIAVESILLLYTFKHKI